MSILSSGPTITGPLAEFLRASELMPGSEPERIFYVYVLFRPSGEVCYVGKGKGNRLRSKSCRNPHLQRIIALAGDMLEGAKVKEGLTEVEAWAFEKCGRHA